MEFPLYRPVASAVSRRPPVPVVSLGGAIVAALLLAFGGVPVAQLPQSILVAALVGGLGLGATLAWAESRLLAVLRHIRAERAFERDRQAFDVDLGRALERERRELIMRAREPGVLVLGAGAIDSEVRIVGESRRLVHEGVPLVVRRPGVIRVLGPPALASSVCAALVEQAASARPDEPPRWTISTAPGHTAPVDCLAEIWLGPEGSAAVRARGQAGGAWVALEPRLG